MDTARIIMIACIVVFTAAGAIIDWRTRKLPNALTVSCFLCAILFHAISGLIDGGASGLGMGLLFSLGGFAAGFGMLFILWLIGGGGGGDVKLFAALGAWLGAWMTFKVLIASTVLVLIGAVFAVLATFFRSGFSGVRGRLRVGRTEDKKKRKKSAEDLQTEKSKRRLVPFGVPVALATWIMLAADELIQSSQTIVK